MITIIMYPRLNIYLGNGLPHFGLMHLLATNLIIWMRTVIKESIHEYHVAEGIAEEDASHPNITGHIHQEEGDPQIEIVSHILHKRFSEPSQAEHALFSAESCKEMYHDDDFVSDVLKATSPFLYAFIIEFSLVGGTFFYNTWNNVNLLRWEEAKEKMPNPTVQKPNLCGTLAKTNWSNSTMGTVCGCFILLLTILDLIMFFSVDYEEDIVFEYIGKVMNCVINLFGVVATIIGCIQIQKLSNKSQGLDNLVDIFLLDLGVFFIFVYSTLTVTVGIFTTDHGMPGSVHISNGIMEIIASSLQVVFIHQLLEKVTFKKS